MISDPSPIDPIFQAAGESWNVEPLLLKAIAAQATDNLMQNLMQIRPDKFKTLGGEDITDPAQQIFAAAKYLSQGFDAGRQGEIQSRMRCIITTVARAGAAHQGKSPRTTCWQFQRDMRR